MNYRLRDQGGAVALIITIVAAVLISIVTISLSEVLSTEQRQSIDVHASERAYEAAQAGIEDGLARIKYWSGHGCIYTEKNGDPPPQLGDIPGGTCDYAGSPHSFYSGLSDCSTIDDTFRRFAETDDEVQGACWTKRWITRVTNDLTASLVADNSAEAKTSAYETTVDLNSTPKTRKLVINWGDTAKNGSESQMCALSNPWPANTPGILQFSLKTVLPDGSTKQAEGLLQPLNCSSKDSALKDVGTQLNPCPNNFVNTSYRFCEIFNLTSDPDAKTVQLVVRAKFASNKFQLTALDQGGNKISLPSNYLQLDVTGRSGDTYRRIIAKKQIGNANNVFSVLDFALFSESELNKNISCYGTDPNATCN